MNTIIIDYDAGNVKSLQFALERLGVKAILTNNSELIAASDRVIFPGQGSQLVGMGKDLHDKYTLVKALFKEADDTLGFSLSSIILNGPKEDLDLTENTQPAIFLIS